MTESQHQSASKVNRLIKPAKVEERGSGLSVAIRYQERCYCEVKVGIQQVDVGMGDDDVFDERAVLLIDGIWGTVSVKCRHVQFLSSSSFSRNYLLR
jgi:hypothetical protein